MCPKLHYGSFAESRTVNLVTAASGVSSERGEHLIALIHNRVNHHDYRLSKSFKAWLWHLQVQCQVKVMNCWYLILKYLVILFINIIKRQLVNLALIHNIHDPFFISFHVVLLVMFLFCSCYDLCSSSCYNYMYVEGWNEMWNWTYHLISSLEFDCKFELSLLLQYFIVPWNLYQEILSGAHLFIVFLWSRCPRMSPSAACCFRSIEHSLMAVIYY